MTLQQYNIDFIELAKSIKSLDKLVPLLIKNGVYSERMLKAKMGGSQSEQIQTLNVVLDLKKKGPKILEKFYQCLIVAEQYSAAKHLNPNFQTQEKQTTNIDAQNMNTNFQIQEKQTTNTPAQHTNTNNFQPAEKEITNFDNNESVKKTLEILEQKRKEAIKAKEGEVYVRPAEKLMDDLTNPRIYRMKSSPKGYALVIVNLQFTRSNYRIGADKDCVMLTSLFRGLGYIVHCHINKTCREMESIIEHFAHDLDHSLVDSCVVAVSTHGNEDCLLGSDSEGYSRNELVYAFNNRRCPDLMHKPKLFFFQACRGDRYDEGIDDAVDGSSHSKAALFSNIWIFSSTIEEYVSWRNTKGSWFIVAITEIFSKHAWNTPLSELYRKVDEYMESFEARTMDRNKQVPELSQIGFRKDLYFNPGKYEMPVNEIQIKQLSAS